MHLKRLNAVRADGQLLIYRMQFLQEAAIWWGPGGGWWGWGRSHWGDSYCQVPGSTKAL